MSAKERSGVVLFISIVGVLLLSIGFLIWSYFYLQRREAGLNELALIRSQQILHVRLDGLFHELAEDLREESAAVQVDDSLVVVTRWMPLLQTHWHIMAIRLADEHGNETAVTREDSTYLLTKTSLGSKEGPPINFRYSEGPRSRLMEGPWLSETDIDPRERVWFSKALEDSRNEATWTLRPADGSNASSLQISYLIRGITRSEPYRILMFTVDLTRSSWMDTRSSALLRAGIQLMDDEGRSLGMLTARRDTILTRASQASLEVWRKRKSVSPFWVEVDNKKYDCLVGAYPLNGQQLFTGLVVDLKPLNLWIRPERVGLGIMAFLLTTLIVLLIWAWGRKRRSDERIRKQARRNRSQELKLAKALGEREVLNREVHHRVKNNLQVVSSLLNLQAMRLDEGAVKNEFLRGKRRIDTIALVHHKLYGLTDLRNVDLERFFQDLILSLSEMHRPQSRTVSTEVITQGTKADQDTAIELGIILCELIANTYQHAFPYATGGHVEIRVQPVEGDLYRLTVKDNGTGIIESGQQGSGKLGLEIVEALAEQLDGSFHMRTNGGVLFEVLFRMQRVVQAEDRSNSTEVTN